MAAADLVELHRSKVTDEGNGVKTFWMRFHGKEEDITWTDGKWAPTSGGTGFAYNSQTNEAIVVGYHMKVSGGGQTSGYFAQSVDYDPRPDNMPGRVLATVVWRKWEDYS